MSGRPKVSVLTVTKRTGWEPLAIWSLENQTVQDYEWIVVREPKLEFIDCGFGSDESFLPAKIIPAPAKKRRSNLNASLNRGLSYCAGEYVLFYQDYIELQADAIALLLENAAPDTFITTATHEDGKFDLRYTGEGLHEIPPNHWEANVALAPMSALKWLGGFDEEYDDRWSWDNCNLAERAHLAGAKFLMDERVQPRLLTHPKERSMETNAEFHEQRMRDIRRGKYPLQLPYL